MQGSTSKAGKKNIVVYCSSRENLAQKFEQVAFKMGKWIGDNGHSLVYGGVAAGLMHSVAAAAKKCGAHVIGVIPEGFRSRADLINDQCIFTSDLNDRKATMIELGDVFIALPGGLGTIDEWISTLSYFTVVGDSRKIIIVNIDGMYDGLIAQLRNTLNSPFARGDFMQNLIFVNTDDELINVLSNL